GVLDKKNLGFTANQGDLFLNAMGIAEDLQEQFFDGQTVLIYREMVTKNRPEVIQYLGELIMLNEVMDSTATAKWNKYHIR
ncbi:hypothetical protein, partial [Pricia sp.]|uniref:hypothetical protein n=1 Tax=Pricia sp. TaxID=2268138 RepID=UPI00359403F5